MTPEMISYFNIDVLHRNFAPPQTEASACALLTRGVLGAEERAPPVALGPCLVHGLSNCKRVLQNAILVNSFDYIYK